MTAAIDLPAAVARELFDATRPPCPAAWCDGKCNDVSHFGDFCWHGGQTAQVPCATDDGDFLTSVELRRRDALGEAGRVGIDVWIDAMPVSDRATFTPAQARRLAIELLRAAELADGAPS